MSIENVKKTNPCFKCEDRELHCHSTCQKYLAWQQFYEDEKQKIRDSFKYENNIINHHRDACYKTKKKLGMIK